MIKALLRGAVFAALGGALVALGLIASDRPSGPTDGIAGGLDFGSLDAGVPMPEPSVVTMRDGYRLQVREYPNAGGPLVVLVHGSGWNGLQFSRLADALSARAHVLVPDLRGHGARPGRRGDVDHIGQFEEDLADLISARASSGQKVVMLGHSSGGGLVVRFAGGTYGQMLDGAVLMAPFLQYDAPTTRPNSGGWARPLTRRIIGLTMLNTVGIRDLNYLTVIEFNMPEEILDGPLGHLATTAYSYRLNQSYAPRRDYGRDISILPSFLLVVGEDDEAFNPGEYEPLMRGFTDKGIYRILPGATHLSVVDDPLALTAVLEFLDGI